MPIENRNGLRVLTLSGTPEQMGEEHGTLLREDINTHLERFILNGERYFDVPCDVLYGMGTHCLSSVPERYLREMKSLAGASGTSFETILGLNCLVDIDAANAACASHCCNFLVRRSASAGGLLMHGRNLDFSHAGIMPKMAVVIIRRPTEVDIRSTIGFAWAGCVGFLTGYNSAQISVGEVGTIAPDANLNGVPFAFLLRDTLERSSTIAECGAHLVQQRRTCGYNVVFCSGQENDALAMECTPSLVGRRGFRRDFLVVDGIPLTATVARNRLVQTADAVRHARMTQLVTDHLGAIDIPTGMRFLQDRFDAVWGSSSGRGFNPICNEHTIHSVLFLPAEKRMFVAQGTIPAPMGAYHELSAEDL